MIIKILIKINFIFDVIKTFLISLWKLILNNVIINIKNNKIKW